MHRLALPCAVFVAFVAMNGFGRIVTPPVARAADCTGTSVGFTPLLDMGPTDRHMGHEGGHYPDASRVPPPAHRERALAAAATVAPLDTGGAPDSAGKIVLLSIGMSNTTQEFNAFLGQAATDPQIAPEVLLVDGAQGGQAAGDIRGADARFWDTVDGRLSSAGSSPEQVQVVWMKQARRSPNEPFPEDARLLEDDLAAIVGVMHDRFPALKLVYLSNRTYAGYATTQLNPEPYAYQSGFAVKWLIQRQIEGDPTLNPDPAAGPVRAPVLLWGPDLWADGLTPRSDGLTWSCSDFRDDGTHPSDPVGRQKVGRMLLSFLKTDDTSRDWFLADPAAPPGPTPTLGAPGPDPAPRPTQPGGRATPDPAAAQSWRVHESPSGDELTVRTSDATVQRRLGSVAGRGEAWLCGTVAPDAALEWGFTLASDGLRVVPDAPAADRVTTIRAIAADPNAVDGATRCLRIDGAREAPTEGATPTSAAPTIEPTSTAVAPTVEPTMAATSVATVAPTREATPDGTDGRTWTLYLPRAVIESPVY